MAVNPESLIRPCLAIASWPNKNARDRQMEVDKNMTLRQARDLFYRQHGFPQDGGVSASWWSPIGCRDLKVYLPNFRWRRKALPYHDLHHILTGYPFRPSGEFQMSAWEFAAGRYPNIYTTLFCLPLVSLGAVLVPRRTFAAYVRGRHSKTLYCRGNYETLLNCTVEKLRREILPGDVVAPSAKDYLAYSGLVAASALVLCSPFLLIGGIIMSII